MASKFRTTSAQSKKMPTLSDNKINNMQLVSPVGGPHSVRGVMGTAAMRNYRKSGVCNVQQRSERISASAAALARAQGNSKTNY